jgi:surface polysaccharide O-acyltransferase-like enzyme
MGWGFTAMFWWTDRYRPVSVPNYDQIGSLTYYLMVVIKQLTVFSLPAFLSISGFFIAFAARGSQTKLNWKVVFNRVVSILIPYIIWSIVLFGLDYITGTIHSLSEYLFLLLTGGASPIYYYVIIITQLFLISPLLIPFAASKHWKKLLLIAGVIQLLMIGWIYLTLAGLVKWKPDLLFTTYIFFYVFGMVLSFHLEQIKAWLLRWRKVWLGVLLFLIVPAVLETEIIFRATGQDWRGGIFNLSAALYAIVFQLVYLGFEEINFTRIKIFFQLGQKTYGMYLAHPVILIVLSKAIYHFTPVILAYQVVYLPIIFLGAVAIPFWIMNVIPRTPLKFLYPYLFG